MTVKDLLRDLSRVIYSPVKAFESIAKKPDIRGPIIILALILVFIAIEQSVLASKIFLADRYPKNDEWTESVSSSWNWVSNGIISLDNDTYIIWFGNYSVRSVVSNSASIWIKITNIGPLDCSKDYARLSFWLKWTNQQGTFPSNLTLRLFSINENQYFKLDATDLISESSGNWIGNWTTPSLGVVTGPDNQNWISTNSPHWETITGLEFMLTWSQEANLTMYIDDLYFAGKSFSYLTTKSLGDYTIFYLINTVIALSPPGFLFTWIAYVGSFFVVSWLFHLKMRSWRALFVVTGYVFASVIVVVLVRVILYSVFPALSFPMSSWPPQNIADAFRRDIIIERLWYPNIVYLTFVTTLGLDIWIAVLCAVSIRAFGKLSWKTAALSTVFAYLMKFFLLGVTMI